MKGPSKKFDSVKEYLASLPIDSQGILKKLRSFIKKVLPDHTQEVISYQMPAFKTEEGIVIWYAAFKEHISIFPRTTKLKSLDGYKGGKGTIQFPKDEPLPYDIIGEFIQFRLVEIKKNSKPKKSTAVRKRKAN
jgi:uncharacterized protein YdhG (YjbR/CyaY superfamily)